MPQIQAELTTEHVIKSMNSASFFLENNEVYLGMYFPKERLTEVNWGSLSKNDASGLLIDMVSNYLDVMVDNTNDLKL